MSDTSHHTAEQRIVVSVWARKSQQTGETKNQVRDDFQQSFGQEASSKQPFLRTKN
jgi:hypothetical protein